MKDKNQLLAVILISMFMVSQGSAEEASRSTDEIARDLANPNTPLTSLKLQSQYFIFDGDLPRADDQDTLRLYFQPTLPFPQENGKTVWVRPGIALSHSINRFTILVVEGLVRWMVGGIAHLTSNTAKPSRTGSFMVLGSQHSFPQPRRMSWEADSGPLGPGFQLGCVSEKTIVGVFANHQWDIAGDGKSPIDRPFIRTPEAQVSLSTIQLFSVLLPGDGWSMGSTPIMTYDHESNQWTIPLHFMVGKTVIINERPWDFSVEVNYYVERPDEIAPEWMVSFNVAPVVKNIFAREIK